MGFVDPEEKNINKYRKYIKRIMEEHNIKERGRKGGERKEKRGKKRRRRYILLIGGFDRTAARFPTYPKA